MNNKDTIRELKTKLKKIKIKQSFLDDLILEDVYQALLQKDKEKMDCLDSLKCNECDGTGTSQSLHFIGPCRACDGSGYGDGDTLRDIIEEQKKLIKE